MIKQVQYIETGITGLPIMHYIGNRLIEGDVDLVGYVETKEKTYKKWLKSNK